MKSSSPASRSEGQASRSLGRGSGSVGRASRRRPGTQHQQTDRLCRTRCDEEVSL